jgi:hypothetical protein
MHSVADLVRRTAERLRTEGEIEAALDKVAETAKAEADLVKAATTARRLLRERLDALEDAEAELQDLIDQIGHLRAIMSYTPDGWPRERKRLRSLLDKDPTAGIAGWLQYWYAAAGSHRLDALAWLVDEVPLPEGADLLAERGKLAASGLEQRNWHLAAPMLEAGATGLRVDGSKVPKLEERASLRLLLARLALTAGMLDQAEEVLGAAEDRETGAAALALQARRHRLARNPEAARPLLVKAQDLDPGDLDVVAELILQAREGKQTDAAIEAARVGVDALGSLFDIDSDLGRLLEPPAELWIAVADRARREGTLELSSRALDEAERLAAWNEYELLAIIAEHKAEAATTRAARLRALLEAGDRRVEAGQMERARINFEKALAVGGDQEESPSLALAAVRFADRLLTRREARGRDVDTGRDVGTGHGKRIRIDLEKALRAAGNKEERRLRALAAMRLADTVATLAAPQPLRLVRDEVAAALERLVDARAVDDLATSQSWSYVTEVELRMNLARAADERRADHLWRAFLAAARAVALSPGDSRRWSRLADVAQDLYCFNAAEIVAAHARELGGDAELPSYVQALTNAGRIEEALRLIGGATDPWSGCVRSYLLLRLRKPKEAVRLLRAVTMDPSWTWAQQTLLLALLLTGEDAAPDAASFAAAIRDQTDEYGILHVLAQFEQVQGHFDRAIDLAEQMLKVQGGLGEWQAASVLGQALLLRGDVDRGDVARGWKLLKEGLSSYRSPMLDDWESVERPQLQALAVRWRGVELGDLDALEPLIAQRRRQLQELSDPFRELERAPVGTADASVVASAKALGSFLLRLARAKEPPPAEALPEIGQDFTAELDALNDHLRNLTDWRRREDMAAQAVRLSSTGDRAGASSLLAQLIDEVPYQVDDLLRNQATQDELRPVGNVLAELSRDARYERPARNVLQWLGMGEFATDVGASPMGASLQVQLPRSWFEEHPDPLRDHALFLRYLPELRLRLTWELPPVRVSVDDALEPDGYRIMAGGELLKEDRVDPSYRYCPDATVAFLPDKVRSLVGNDTALGLRRIPAGPVLDDALAEQLTMPAIEVVTRLVGEVAKRAVDPGAVGTQPGGASSRSARRAARR